MIVLTNPMDIDHEFGFNQVNLNDSYQTPLSGNYSYIYDKDRRLIRKIFPSGKQIENIYDKTQLVQVQTAESTIEYTYLCGSKVGSISKGSDTINYEYDGKLVTSETISGSLNQSIEYAYNNDFNITSFTYAGGTVGFIYDNDGLLTGAGDFTIARNTPNGLPESVSGSGLNLSRTFNGYGELDGLDFSVTGQSLSSWNETRNNAGRITEKSETLLGATSDFIEGDVFN